ncbi:MAG: hypothetical protein C0501_29865 [Isosphaera sp.]|nr:hypothetical protein [Isosphaera sp.]
MAVANYLDTNGRFPPAFVRGPDGRPWHSWRVLILPFIEERDLHRDYRFDEPWDGPANRLLAGRMPRLLAFHGSEPGTTTNYLAVVGSDTMWPGAEGRDRADITDGWSETILIVENAGLGVHWMEPRDLLFDGMDFAVDRPGGVSSWYESPAVVTADATVRRLSRGIRPDALRAALTVNGGEGLADDGNGWTVLPDGRQRNPKP